MNAPTSDIPPGNGSSGTGPRWERWAVALLLAYFLTRLVYFAIAIAPGIPPDEPTHMGLIRLYSEAVLFIDDSEQSYALGLVTHVPFLYHLLMGKLLLANVFPADDLTYLRWLNVALSGLTAVAGYVLARRMLTSSYSRVLFVALMTNTLMYTFIGAAVSYDNLVNLLSVLSLLLLHRFLGDGRPGALVLLALCLMLGSLTKTSFLPLVVIILGILVVDRGSELGNDLAKAARWTVHSRPIGPIVGLLVVLSAGGSLWLYGANLARYGRVVPSCEQVLALEHCQQNRIFARNWLVKQYREDALNFDEAVRASSMIAHRGDRDHAIRLLRNEEQYKRSRPAAMPLWDYLDVVWDQAMMPTIFGVQAHYSILRPPGGLVPYALVFFAGFILWVRSVGWSGEERPWAYLALIVIGYYLTLVGFHNYRGYLVTHAPFLGVQGRYIFPVLVPAYLLLARALTSRGGRVVRLVVVLLISVLFIAGDFPYYRGHENRDWFERRPDTTVSHAATAWDPQGFVISKRIIEPSGLEARNLRGPRGSTTD